MTNWSNAHRAAGLPLVLALASFVASPSQAASDGAYAADAAQSRLDFTGVQAGAEFKGVFPKFTATVDLSPQALGAARIDVQIDLKSVDTQDKERDDTLRGSDLFDVAHYGSAHYVTRSIQKTATGYAATGTLTLRGVTRDVPIQFTFTPAGTGATLKGAATLNRLDFGVGQGDWKNTDWVGNAVRVNFTLVLKPRG